MDNRFRRHAFAWQALRILALIPLLVALVLVSRAGPAHAAPPPPGSVVLDPTAVSPPIFPRKAPTTVTVDLVAKEVIAELAPGVPYWFWTFNGTVPGPMIRVMEGDTVVINLTNALEDVEPHNIDFHAAMGPGGGAAVTNVEPGETKTLMFKALRPGAYIYHCAGEGMPWEHVAHGMYGLIMVEPKGGLPLVDKEFIVGQSDWYVRPMDAEVKEKLGLPPEAVVYDMDEDKAFAEHPDYFTFNGHTKALTDPNLFGDQIMVQQGDSWRFFFVTGGPNIGSNWHIIGQIFDKVYTGHPKTFVMNEETVYVPPGSAAVFEGQALVPGKYLLVDHALFRVPKGAAGFMHVEGPACAGGQVVDPAAWPSELFFPPACTSGH